MRRHLKTNKHCEKARSITNYILDFLDSPKAKAIERSSYKADPSTTNSYLYQQTMPKKQRNVPLGPASLRKQLHQIQKESTDPSIY